MSFKQQQVGDDAAIQQNDAAPKFFASVPTGPANLVRHRSLAPKAFGADLVDS